MADRKNLAAVALGRRGGKVASAAKTSAARKNGKKGGRPLLPKRPLPEQRERDEDGKE
jgi:hypothetical protein